MLAEYSEAYVAKMVMVAKALFRDCVRRRLLTESPFGAVRSGSQSNASRLRMIDVETIEKVIAATRDSEWKLLITLARFGGFRTPSESLALRWEDILWDQKKLIVHSPKTAHHGGHEQRVVPLFPEIEVHLLKVYEEALPGAEFVITRYRGDAANLRTQFKRIIERAGVTPWPKLWQNLRSTRATELLERFPGHVVSAWLGHSERVADRHYRQVTDDHFAQAVSVAGNATQNPTLQPAETGCNSRRPTPPVSSNSGEKRENQGEPEGIEWAIQGSNL